MATGLVARDGKLVDAGQAAGRAPGSPLMTWKLD